jgi:hypothetical protein
MKLICLFLLAVTKKIHLSQIYFFTSDHLLIAVENKVLRSEFVYP